MENKIRDFLAANLPSFFPNLILISKEYYLPNALGTRGFIDILARDAERNYVVIEIKRSDATSRETIHELLKYAEGLKESKGVKESEIKLFVLSTEWKELLIPFSSFIKMTTFTTKGYKLEVDLIFGSIMISS